MRVTLRYLEDIPAFIYAAESSLRKHYDHVQFAKSKVKQENLYDGKTWGYQKILDDYNWIKDEKQFGTTCPTGRVSHRKNFEP